ncbi:hypothetical protein [Haloarcula marina]|uniref:hypothetical protein n=1 Tax=Haloarcula marina TaxID=2961574 RepID=UPI0020B82691|nr:hypothetical protein [Halomicroarcula marina]
MEIDWQIDRIHTVTVYDNTIMQAIQTNATCMTFNNSYIGFVPTFIRPKRNFDTIMRSSKKILTVEVGFDSLIQRFEHNTLDGYYSFHRGESASSIVRSPVNGGGFVLELSGTSTEMINTTSLDGYSQLDGNPKSGETFRYHFRTPDPSGSANFIFGPRPRNSGVH